MIGAGAVYPYFFIYTLPIGGIPASIVQFLTIRSFIRKKEEKSSINLVSLLFSVIGAVIGFIFGAYFALSHIRTTGCALYGVFSSKTREKKGKSDESD